MGPRPLPPFFPPPRAFHPAPPPATPSAPALVKNHGGKFARPAPPKKPPPASPVAPCCNPAPESSQSVPWTSHACRRKAANPRLQSRSPAEAPRVPLLSAHPVAPVALASHIAPLLGDPRKSPRSPLAALRSTDPSKARHREDRWCKSLRPGETTLSAIQIAPETLPKADAVPCAAACGQIAAAS